MSDAAKEDTTVDSSALTRASRPLPLSSAAKGSGLIITGIPEGRARTQLIRLGIMEGETIRCVERLPGGTVVIEKSRQEIAIGAALAKTILVERAATEERSSR